MSNNNLLQNAAFVGFVEGALAGRANLSSTPASFAALMNAAQSFAARVDSKILRDNAISDVNGSHLPNTNNVVVSHTLCKMNLMTRIAAALIQGRYSENNVIASWDSLATQVVAAYTQAITQPTFQ